MAASLRHVNLKWPNSGIAACSDISLDVLPGTVHALLGENGAGKTTLGHILAGVLRPDTGKLTLNGREIDLPKNSMKALPGVGLVRQRSIWPANLRLWEAAILGRKKGIHRPSIAINAFRRCTEEWLIPDLNPNNQVGKLDAATLQRSELTVALMNNPQLIILDEPVAGWGEGRKEELYNLLCRFKRHRMGVLLITHRLDDVFQVAEHLTVLTHGHVTACGPVDSFDSTEVMRLMFSHDTMNLPVADAMEEGFLQAGAPRRQAEKIETITNRDFLELPQSSKAVPPVLRFDAVSLKKTKREELHPVNFSLSYGKILGITGMKKEGLGQLEDIISGRCSPTGGRVFLDGKLIRGKCIRTRMDGMGHVPSEAMTRGVSLESTVAENLLMLSAKQLTHHGWLHPKRVRQWAEMRLKEGGIKGEANQCLMKLSRGNIQKLILKREIDYAKKLLLLTEPTMNLDAKSRLVVHRILRESASRGMAILLLTTDIDEALEFSDDVAVISRGQISPIRPVNVWDRQEIAARIAGLWEDKPGLWEDKHQ